MLSLVSGVLVAGWIGWDETRRPQPMWIMNIVWPVAALFGTVLLLWGYLKFGRSAAGSATKSRRSTPDTPFSVMVGKGALHCGAGCTLGDIVAESLATFFPGVALWFGWRNLFDEKMFAVWILDYMLAFLLGVAFQYFTIRPMRGLSVRDGLIEALKADALSLTAWQVGMYGFMAFAQFGVFRPVLGFSLAADSVEFWFMMQFAMIAGFLTSYPVNWWLLKAGIKEKM
ncbi:DUF4396 domain-containing protein [Mesorhizobium sp. CA8]|uniref:DUF4396 domain-containing protein n=1 Tax=Mesorhizobium sp. CA8 TaxID=2876637 RepID=UPI001CCF9F7C|nr:DUF4396 domain-containing protein [Mesorhizobium sp. CA8]MBZ9764273.1 DUF4396 domain-containing protein [Mesorhizobium sp. CA8]